MKYCKLDNCDIQHYCKGYCQKHFTRFKRHGDPNFIKTKTECDVEKCDNEHIEAHHDSYLPENWLNIRWLCVLCHAEWHKRNKPIMPNK